MAVVDAGIVVEEAARSAMADAQPVSAILEEEVGCLVLTLPS